jgi:hypothetical protein
MAGTPSPHAGHTPRAVVRPAEVGDRCRCGTRIAPGTKCLQIVDAPRELADWIQGRSFCGPDCARHYLLESMEQLEGAMGGGETVRALRAVIVSLDAAPEDLTVPPPSHRAP